MNEQPVRVVGIDIGGTFIKAGLVDGDGRLLGRYMHASEAQRGWPHFLDRIGQAVDALLAERGLGAGDVAGIGVGYPGTVYPDTGLISGSPNIPGAEGQNLVQPLEERFGLVIAPINDASAAALGEFVAGRESRPGARSLVMFTLGTGVGGGVVIDGRVLYGAHHQGAELGHMIVDPHGPLCGCGNFGCLEALCGTAGILARAWRKLQSGRPSVLREMIREFQEPELTPLMISQAAAQDDALALEVWEETGFWLGCGCVTAINMLDPDVIVIGGQIAKAGAPLFDAVRRTVRSRQRLNPWPVDRIVPAGLGEDAGIVGAAMAALRAAAPRPAFAEAAPPAR